MPRPRTCPRASPVGLVLSPAWPRAPAASPSPVSRARKPPKKTVVGARDPELLGQTHRQPPGLEVDFSRADVRRGGAPDLWGRKLSQGRNVRTELSSVFRSYFISKKCLFSNRRGIATQDEPAMADHGHARRGEGEVSFF